jgi:hypothetical protein
MSKVFIGYLFNANSTSSDHTPRKLTAPASLVEVGYFFANFCRSIFRLDDLAIVRE